MVGDVQCGKLNQYVYFLFSILGSNMEEKCSTYTYCLVCWWPSCTA